MLSQEKRGESYFYNDKVKWALTLEPRVQRFFFEAELDLYQSSTAYEPDIAFKQLIKSLRRSEQLTLTET